MDTKNRSKTEPIVIDGWGNFLFVNQNGNPKVAIDYNGLFNHIVKKYNKQHDTALPHITPHTLRHTFCAKLAQRNMNPKDLQYFMGHSSIGITTNWCAHSSIDSAKTEVKRLIA
ncbi:tyrosine-type recombinase/integrase [Clostridioides sp. ZZV14-6154]|nr:tyrosine-type recombinase/integrase [Clostridioides sp. ZZV14-6150]MCC0659520.1 tyrosine-type recombinase/integrase [Clostridioides sp. ZZV14-6154]MCC0723741.1 tyrosine-type recombinase/integrase [Clostridioides sp. ZZV14-6104]MCC0742216.1 tyrosine-type recombinase/integrase [Clostridioides sp. ZZV14-6044]MCC0752168.1 tyrosine-type recombinase/integrase [Clostridioides sp. ZZV13-5731]